MKNTELKAMADRIKLSRKNLGYTQERFCEVIDISIGSYTKIENAFQKPSLDTLIRISQKLNVSLDYLVFGEGEQGTVDIAYTNALANVMQNADTDKIKYVSDLLNQITNLKN